MRSNKENAFYDSNWFLPQETEQGLSLSRARLLCSAVYFFSGKLLAGNISSPEQDLHNKFRSKFQVSSFSSIWDTSSRSLSFNTVIGKLARAENRNDGRKQQSCCGRGQRNEAAGSQSMLRSTSVLVQGILNRFELSRTEHFKSATFFASEEGRLSFFCPDRLFIYRSLCTGECL